MDSKDFNFFLKSLPNISGFGLYFLETAYGYINYNEVSNTFQRLIDGKGYRPYSLSFVESLSNSFIDYLYEDVEKDCFVFSKYDMFSRKRTILLNGFENRSKGKKDAGKDTKLS